ncbi:MAG: twin-arginine translocation signal domain-containing protein, partial [Nitrososphaeraceae archaeon]
MTEIRVSRRKFLKILGAGIAVLAFGALSGFGLLSKRSPLFHDDKSSTTTTRTTTVTTPLTPSGSPDKFGIQMLFATMPGGREWFMNMDDPNSDEIFEA